MGPYPRWRYHTSKEAVIVHSAEQDQALGDGWVDSPADLEKKERPTEAQASQKSLVSESPRKRGRGSKSA